MNLLGLIGYPLSHSFSKKYFADKFQREGIKGWNYELFPIEDIDFFPTLVDEYPELKGLNVTIPYKEKVVDYLDELDEAVHQIGAVNTIRIVDGKLKGFNTDVYGFQRTLEKFLASSSFGESLNKAMVLGTGGAAKAVCYVLDQLNFEYLRVSRSDGKGDLTYKDMNGIHIDQYPLIINTTPLGMSPNIETCPEIPYDSLTEKNFLYDLVYNPEKTLFLNRGTEKGASTLNGYNMLVDQAEKAWEIWTSNPIQ